jgi:hypothetical protein
LRKFLDAIKAYAAILAAYEVWPIASTRRRVTDDSGPLEKGDAIGQIKYSGRKLGDPAANEENDVMQRS